MVLVRQTALPYFRGKYKLHFSSIQVRNEKKLKKKLKKIHLQHFLSFFSLQKDDSQHIFGSFYKTACARNPLFYPLIQEPFSLHFVNQLKIPNEENRKKR